MIEQLLMLTAIVAVIVWLVAWNRRSSLRHAAAMANINQTIKDLRTGAANRKRQNKPGELTFEQICKEWEGVSEGQAVAFPIEKALDWCIAEIHRLQLAHVPLDDEELKLMAEVAFHNDISARDADESRRQFLQRIDRHTRPEGGV